MSRKTSLLFHFGFVLLITSSACLGMLWLRPQDFPPSHTPPIMAAMDQVTAKLFDKNYKLYAHLEMEHMQFFPKNIITAQMANIHLQDKYRTHLMAHRIIIEPHQPWRFYTTQLHRHQAKCALSIQSSYLEYHKQTQIFSTKSEVSANIGRTQMTMQGINIPTKNKTIFFGHHLKGSLDLNDPCNLDFSV